MVSVIASSVVHHGFYPWLGQTKYYKIGICCFSTMTKYTALRSKTRTWLSQESGENESEMSDRSFCGLMFQRVSTIKIQLSVFGLLQNTYHPHLFKKSFIFAMDYGE